MSLLYKEVDDFEAYAYHQKQFKKVTKKDLLGKWTLFFFYPADFTFVCPTELEDLQEKYQENIELFNDIIQALEKGNISNDKDGALDLAWHINGGSEYGFYDFSVESNLRAQRRLSEETNPNNVFWTTNRQFKFAKTYPALLGIFEKAEQENPDFADEINIYQEEIKNQEVYLNEEVTQVIQAMNELTNKLLEY